MNFDRAASGLLLPEPPPAPEPRRGSVAFLLRDHPLPWQCGEEHETMAEVYDARGRLVIRLKPSFGVSPHILSEWLVERANQETT